MRREALVRRPSARSHRSAHTSSAAVHTLTGSSHSARACPSRSIVMTILLRVEQRSQLGELFFRELGVLRQKLEGGPRGAAEGLADEIGPRGAPRVDLP